MQKILSTALMATAAMALAGCAGTAANYGAQDASPPTATIQQTAGDMPYAGPNAPLDRSAALTRIAFGSCVQQDNPQTFWNTIAATDPGLFLLIGDNVYGDDRDGNKPGLPKLSASYAKLATAPEFASFRANIPMMTTWDDHDYGENDGGAAFDQKRRAEDIFEHFWNSSAAVRARPGIYESHMIGPAGKRVQIIMLDERYFRSPLARKPEVARVEGTGPYVADPDPALTMLGDAQWNWLEQELGKPADLRLIVSSMQVITKAHDWEAWQNMPAQRDKLYALMAKKRIDNAVLLSGDRHSGALYKTNLAGLKNPLWEITSSSLNFSFREGDQSASEPDSDRIGGFYSDENFGLVDIDWAAKTVRLSLRHSDGREIIAREVKAIR